MATRLRRRHRRLQADLQAEDDQLRVEAALALWRVRGEGAAIAALEQLVSTGHDPAAFEACLALAEIGPDACASIPALLAALAGTDVDVRRAAAQALGAIGPAALGPIVERLADQSAPLEPAAQASAADALGLAAQTLRRGRSDRPGRDPEPAEADPDSADDPPVDDLVVQALAGLLKSEGTGVEQHAARALAHWGFAGLPALADALSSERASLREAADVALDAFEPLDSQVPDPRYAPHLAAAARALDRALAGDRRARQAAARTFALFPLPAGAETIDRLRRLITTDDLATRHYAAQALVRLEKQKSAR